MTERQRKYTAISRVAWGYFLCHVGFNWYGIDLLPDFVGYLMLLSAISLLAKERKSLRLLQPFGWMLAVWFTISWFGTLLGVSLPVRIPLLNLLMQLISIYFTFQFLTDLAIFAESSGDTKCRWRGHAPPSRELIKGRNRQVIMLTALTALGYLPQPEVTWWQYVMLLPAIIVLIIIIDIIVALFDLRKLFRPLPPAEKEPSE